MSKTEYMVHITDLMGSREYGPFRNRLHAELFIDNRARGKCIGAAIVPVPPQPQEPPADE